MDPVYSDKPSQLQIISGGRLFFDIRQTPQFCIKRNKRYDALVEFVDHLRHVFKEDLDTQPSARGSLPFIEPLAVEIFG